MRVQCSLIFFTICLLGSSHAFSDQDAMSSLQAAKSLRCSFADGTVTTWASGKPITKADRFNFTLTLDAIDKKTNTARMLGSDSAEDVILLSDAAGLTFIQSSLVGNHAFTTVLSYYAKGTKNFIAVHSRHTNMAITTPRLSQYHGTCSVLQ